MATRPVLPARTATQAHRGRFNKLRGYEHRRGYLEFLDSYQGEDTGANILRFGWDRSSEAEKGVYITLAQNTNFDNGCRGLVSLLLFLCSRNLLWLR
jgi:hypothetical protein